MTRDDHLEDDPEHDPDEGGDSLDEKAEGLSSGKVLPPTIGLRLPTGFAQSLMPNMDNIVTRALGSLQDQTKGMRPDTATYAREIMESLNRRLQDQLKAAMPNMDVLARKIPESYGAQLQQQMASVMATLPTFTATAIDLPAMKGIGLSSVADTALKQITDQQSMILERFRVSLKPLFDPELLRGLNRVFLPPNLKEHADEIRARQVHVFLEQEGIPLYLVPRGRTALRLLRAEDRSARRQVLGDCYESIIDDCAAVLEQADQAAVGDEVGFALDGLGAMRAGHTRSAQAMFTVTLDTLIYRFYPDRAARGLITNRQKGADVPDAIDEMGIYEAMVWLPIWNAHEQFWKHKGDTVPHYYSRHASVHGVSARQFSKRNCVQVLMLVTSLIGYADRLVASPARTSA